MVQRTGSLPLPLPSPATPCTSSSMSPASPTVLSPNRQLQGPACCRHTRSQPGQIPGSASDAACGSLRHLPRRYGGAAAALQPRTHRHRQCLLRHAAALRAIAAELFAWS